MVLQDRAAALDEHGVAPAAVVLGDPFPGAHDAEPGGPVQGGLAAFSGKMLDWMVQIPAASVEAISASRSARPMPWPRASG